MSLIELEVGSVAHGGHCVARDGDGRVVFVRHTLPGERVRARITEERTGYLRADAVEILVASPDRVIPPCPWAGPDLCGGCDFQHAAPARQRTLKAAVLTEQLVRLGGLDDSDVAALGIEVQELPLDAAAPGLDWRTRIRYTVDSEGRAGLLKHRSHEVVPVDWCRIAHPLVRSAGVTGGTWPGEAVDVVASGAGETVVLSERGRVGPALVHERAAGREWTIPPGAFWQVHPAAASVFADVVVSSLGPRPSDRVWDLYGGAGLFAAALAPHVAATGRITIVESDARAATAARRSLADLTTITVHHGPVERALANPRWRSVDLVVLDPPRCGAGARVVRAIARRRPRAVAYVACDPAALGRDVRTFREQGYQLSALRAYDAFPMTHHVEAIASFAPAETQR